MLQSAMKISWRHIIVESSFETVIHLSGRLWSSVRNLLRSIDPSILADPQFWKESLININLGLWTRSLSQQYVNVLYSSILSFHLISSAPSLYLSILTFSSIKCALNGLELILGHIKPVIPLSYKWHLVSQGRNVFGFNCARVKCEQQWLHVPLQNIIDLFTTALKQTGNFSNLQISLLKCGNQESSQKTIAWICFGDQNRHESK